MSPTKTAIAGGCVLTPEGERHKVLVFEGPRILGLADEAPSDTAVIDAAGAYVSPGFIDIHTHGAGGADFMDGTVEAYLIAARMHAVHGTTLLFPTTLTSGAQYTFFMVNSIIVKNEQSTATKGAGIRLTGKTTKS